MEPFRIHTGTVAPLDRPNVDTDQIIPKQFLKRIERTGFGEFLFYDWRYEAGGRVNGSFVLNRPRYSDATVLVTGRNFGCGSSREHAPWALYDYGFRAIIAPSFADIFRTNCLKNGLLAIALPEPEVEHLMQCAGETGGYLLTIDLERRLIEDKLGFSCSFDIDDFHCYCMMNGLDEIDLTLEYETKINAYEAARSKWLP